MAEYLTQCPKCKSTALEVIKEHNPDTLDMNMNVTFRCGLPAPEGVDPVHAVEGCGHEFEGRETSHAHQRERERGISI